jgi:hypothetical protein
VLNRPPPFSSPQGFDEYMNLVLDGVEEIDSRPKARGGAPKRKALGRILLKGDNITAVCTIAPAGGAAAAEADAGPEL